MKIKALALAGAAAAMASGSAAADLIGPVVVDNGGAGGIWVFEVIFQFDNPDDRVDGVLSSTASPVEFQSAAPLLNSDPSDLFGPLLGPGDSAVGVGFGGDLTPGWPSVSPTFPNGNGTVSGTEWSIPVGEAWFQAGGVPASVNQGVPGGVRIAYFSIDPTGPGWFSFSGALQYRRAGGFQNESYEFMIIQPYPPAPGAVGVLAVAALVGVRRRRRIG